MLEVKNLTKSFGGVQAVKNFDFSLNKGEILALIGPNGAGKTTVFNLLTGAIKPDSGTIRFEGKNIENFPPHKVCKMGIGRTYQIVRPFANLTVLQNVLVAGLFGKARKKSEDIQKRAEELLEFVGLTDRKDRLAKDLNLFQRRSLELARALASDPRLLLLDEVASGLNAVEIEAISDKVREINRRGMTLIVVEHVMQFVLGISNRVIVLNQGQKIAEGSPQEVIDNPKVIESYIGKTHAGN